jgi:hypothetical protein
VLLSPCSERLPRRFKKRRWHHDLRCLALQQWQHLDNVGLPVGIFPQRGAAVGAVRQIFVGPHMDDLIQLANIGVVITHHAAQHALLDLQAFLFIQVQIVPPFSGVRGVGALFDEHGFESFVQFFMAGEDSPWPYFLTFTPVHSKMLARINDDTCACGRSQVRDAGQHRNDHIFGCDGAVDWCRPMGGRSATDETG